MSGFHNHAPILEFISRDNQVSDMVGEKLDARHVAGSIRKIEGAIGYRFQFAMLAPDRNDDRAGYNLFVEASVGTEPDFQDMAAIMEKEPCRNDHYRHVRNLRQFGPVRIFVIHGNTAEIYRRRMIKKGMKVGDIKFRRYRGIAAGNMCLMGTANGPWTSWN